MAEEYDKEADRSRAQLCLAEESMQRLEENLHESRSYAQELLDEDNTKADTITRQALLLDKAERDLDQQKEELAAAKQRITELEAELAKSAKSTTGSSRDQTRGGAAMKKQIADLTAETSDLKRQLVASRAESASWKKQFVTLKAEPARGAIMPSPQPASEVPESSEQVTALIESQKVLEDLLAETRNELAAYKVD